MRTKLISLGIIAWLLSLFPLTAMARQIDHNQVGSISITLVSPAPDQPIAAAELSVYYVATVDSGTDGAMRYTCTDAFAECGFSLDDPELTEKLDAFVMANPVACRKIVTDSQGNGHCGDLPLGLYFVKQTTEVEGFAPCTPFLVTVPMEMDAGYQYHVDASPKTEVARLIEVTIKKVWNTGSSTEIPANVTVQLLRHAEVVKTATLDSRNNWQVTYSNMPESDGYSIQEIDVPQGFTATYSQRGYVFTVTNTPSLAQTGQLIWPIPLFALAGIVFLMVGFVILRKPGNDHA